MQSANNCFINYIFSYLAVSPAGHPFNKYNNIKELLYYFCDTIKAHKLLFINGKILHWDISFNNIIITDPKDANNFINIFINLDLATNININNKNKQNNIQEIIGTFKYITIEIVEFIFYNTQRDLEHTYQYDLKFFFYIFLDICINCGRANNLKQKKDTLRV